MASSWKQKLVGAVATGAIVAGLFPGFALAAPPDLYLDSDTSAATATAPAGPAYKLTVDGLAAKDETTFYQVVELDVDSYEPAGSYVAGQTYYTRTGSAPDYTYTVVSEPAAADVANYYVVKTGTQQWRLHDNVAEEVTIEGATVRIVKGTKDMTFNGHKGLRVEDLLMKDVKLNDAGDEVDAEQTDTRVLTKDMANAIASALSMNATKSPSYSAKVADGSTKVEIPSAEAGMYMVVAVPGEGNTDYIYKPIFVSADYYNSVSLPEDNTHMITLVDNDTDYSGDPKVFKRSPLSIDKKSGKWNGNTPVDMQNDVAVGDVVDFTITVPMPTYSTNFTAPQFNVTDILTEGLQLTDDDIVVTVTQEGSTANLAQAGRDYTIHRNKDVTNENDINGFVVQFHYENVSADANEDGNATNDKDGILYTITGAPTVTITYKAKVTSTAAQQVNQMDNTATLDYSNDPNYYDASTYDDGETPPTPPSTPNTPNPDEPTGKLEDKTRHYTFDIDGDILGPNQSINPDTGQPYEDDDEENHDKTSEIRKVWLDAAGNEIAEKQHSAVSKDGTSGVETTAGNYNWLEGAEFELKQTHCFLTTGEGTPSEANFSTTDKDGNSVEQIIKFDANHVRSADGTKNPTSDANGYIAMKGLDAGIYELREIKAPLGYTFNPNVKYTIKITPTYVMEKAATEADPTLTTYDGKKSGDDLILKSYTVEIVTQQLKDNLDIDGEKTITTVTTYTVGDDTTGNPISFLNAEDITAVDPETGDETVVTPAGSLIAKTSDITITNTDPVAESAMIINKKLGFLPATGGSGIIFYLVIGGAVAGMATFLLNKTKRDDLV